MVIRWSLPECSFVKDVTYDLYLSAVKWSDGRSQMWRQVFVGKRKDYIIDNVKKYHFIHVNKNITSVRKIFTSREKIQCNFNFNNWILFWWINESGIWEVAPILVSKVIDRTKSNNLLRLVTSFGTISLNWFSNTSFSVGGRICGLSHVKTINEMTNLWLFDNKGRQEPLNLILLAKSFFVVQCFGGNS